MTDLVENLRRLARYVHDDMTVASEAADEIERLRKETEELIPAPVIDWVSTNAPDPRDAYITRINGHVVGVHSSEEAARNHAWALEAYLGMHFPKARGEE